MGRWRVVLLVALGVLACAPTAHAASLPTGPEPRPGPEILYAPAPRAPQLENTGIWRAAPILVSGATAYRDGEFVYQDFLFDDHGARLSSDSADERSSRQNFSAVNGTITYPSDKAKYANNVADLVEVRIRPLEDAIAFRLTFNSMTDPALVGTTIALGTAPEPRTAPFGTNVRIPAAVFVTVHGTTGDARRADTGAALPKPTVSVDGERRQVDVRVPRAAWDPGTGIGRVRVATGLWDAANGRYLVPGRTRTATSPGGAGTASSPPVFFNVAFRTDEPLPTITNPVQPFNDPRWWRDRAQAQSLGDNELLEFPADVDFGKLARGESDERGVPTTGALNRILASRFDEPKRSEDVPQGVDFAKACGDDEACKGAYQGQLQPYAVYVPPEKPVPAGGWGLTLLLHSLAGNHNQYSGSRNQSQLGDRTSGHIVITPLGRGPDGWYYDRAEADVFEVWADVARHYPLDPGRVALTGYSMGGYGTYKLGSRYPDLFGAANTTVGPPALGISADGRQSTGGPETSTLPQLEGFRHIPVIVWAATTDELVPFSGVVAQVQRLDALGFRYIFDAFSPADHFSLAVNDQYAPVAEFLGDARVVRDPAHVSYVVNPTMDFPGAGVVADHAYWLTRVVRRSPAPVRGRIDVRARRSGRDDPQPGATATGAGVLTGGSQPGFAFARRAKGWGPAPAAAARDELVITAENVSKVTIDPGRAGVTCNARLDVDTDGPLQVTLAGCDRSARFTARGGPSCRPAVAFERARVAARGRALRVDARRRGGRPFAVDVFRQSAGRRIIGERRVARHSARTRSLTVRVPAGDGAYVVRLSARLANGRRDVRRFAFVRRGGRFTAAPAYYRRRSCGLLSSAKLERPVFGGDRNRALGIAFRVARTSVVSVRVTRDGRTVRRFPSRTRRARTTHRLRLPSERRARGVHRVHIEVRPRDGSAPVRATLTARRL